MRIDPELDRLADRLVDGTTTALSEAEAREAALSESVDVS